MKLRQSILIGGSAILTIAGLLLVPYRNLNKIQALLFVGATAAGFTAGANGRKLEQDQEAFDLQVFEVKQHQKMLEQSTLEVLQMEEVAIAKSRAQANVQIQSLQHQQHLQTLKQLKFPGLLEVEIEEARRRSELEQIQNIGRGDRQLQPSENGDSVSTNSELKAIQSANPHLEFYDFDDLVDDAAGIIIAGNTGAGKTSVACYVAGKLTEHAPAQVFALDPHYNDIWKEVGIHAIGEFDEIEEIINLLVKELDDRRARKRDGQPIGETIICFTDELNACLLNCENQDSLETALKRLGSEGRKFGIILIAINQSSNVDDLGISGPYRANFLLILLGASARTISEKWKQTDDRVKWINDQVYPCCVAGCVGTKLAIHPTHNSYVKFKKKGNPPLNLFPINQSEHTFLPEKYRPQTSKGVVQSSLTSVDPIVHIDAQRQQLDALYFQSNIANQLRNEMTPEEIDELIKSLQCGDTTSIDVSDTSLIPKNVSNTYQEPYQTPESLCNKDFPRIWEVSDFAKYLPDRDELVLFEQLCAYQDTSRAGSEIIKKAWKFSSGAAYRRVGQPCFAYIVNKYGSEAQKKFYAPFIEKFLAVNDGDSE